MKTYLIKNSWRPLGWFLVLPSLALGIAVMYFDYEISALKFEDSLLSTFYEGDFLSGNMNMTDELAALGTIVGLFLLVFSAEKLEDEGITQLRWRALSWAVWLHYMILIVAIFFVHGTDFFSVLVYNMFTLLVLFGLRFRWLMWIETKRGREHD
jgi:hypothetical protein